jgi:hypothetical protein
VRARTLIRGEVPWAVPGSNRRPPACESSRRHSHEGLICLQTHAFRSRRPSCGESGDSRRFGQRRGRCCPMTTQLPRNAVAARLSWARESGTQDDSSIARTRPLARPPTARQQRPRHAAQSPSRLSPEPVRRSPSRRRRLSASADTRPNRRSSCGSRSAGASSTPVRVAVWGPQSTRQALLRLAANVNVGLPRSRAEAVRRSLRRSSTEATIPRLRPLMKRRRTREWVGHVCGVQAPRSSSRPSP